MKLSEGPKAKIPGTSIETGWVLVTPDVAKLYLMANIDNRAIRPKHVDRLMHDMNEDRFNITHQGVAFDENGVLIDGQHRLQAIIDSGKGQWLLVTTGLPPIAKRVVDGGAKRKAADFMPGKFRDMRAATIRIMLAIEQRDGIFTAQELAAEMQQVTAAAIQENWDTFFQSDPDELCGMALDASRNVATCGPSALLTGALLYPTTAKEFLVGLHTMVGLQTGDARLALLRFRGGPKRIQTPTAAFMSTKAAKAFHQGREVRVLRFSSSERLRV